MQRLEVAEYTVIEKLKKMASELQFSVMVDPLGTDLVKSGSLRANTLLNETGKTNLPQHPSASFLSFFLITHFWVYRYNI